MTITAIEKTKRGRYSLFVDGEFLFSIHRDTFFSSKLCTGLTLTVQELESLRESDEAYSAKERALSLLGFSSHSAGMLTEKLCRDYSRETTEKVVSRMKELGLVNDREYATRLALDLVNLKGWSLNRVRQELRKRSLSPLDIEEALSQFEEDRDIQAAIRLILKKYKSKIFDRDGMRKTIAALQRQGFPLGTIRAALEEIEEKELYVE